MRTQTPGLDQDQVTEAWIAYKSGGDMRARESLILHYQPLVRAVAKRVGVSLPAHIDNEDLISYGLFGLMDAIEKFDLDREIKFETYAPRRIRGSIIDVLRDLDWVPRSVRSQVRDINLASQGLAAELQREPTEGEVADALNLSVEELRTNRGQQNFIHVGALDAVIGPDSESEFSLKTQIIDVRTQSPEGAYELTEVKEALARAVGQLPERDLIVLGLYYYEGLTLSDIGALLRVTESRVCQMHTRAMSAVRSRLAVA